MSITIVWVKASNCARYIDSIWSDPKNAASRIAYLRGAFSSDYSVSSIEGVIEDAVVKPEVAA